MRMLTSLHIMPLGWGVETCDINSRLLNTNQIVIYACNRFTPEKSNQTGSANLSQFALFFGFLDLLEDLTSL